MGHAHAIAIQPDVLPRNGVMPALQKFNTKTFLSPVERSNSKAGKQLLMPREAVIITQNGQHLSCLQCVADAGKYC